MSTTYGYGITIPAPAGLDPARYVVTLGVHRRNGAALTAAEVEAIAAALASMEAPEAAPAGDPAVVSAHETAAKKRHEAMVAKVKGTAAKPRKAAKKATGAKPRKPTKAPTRKAARRPAKG